MAVLYLALIVGLVGWSWGWIGMRRAVPHFGPGPLAFGRYTIAGLALLPLWWARGRPLPARRDLPGVLAMGLLGFSIYNWTINAAQVTIPAGVASMIVSTIPVLTTVAAVLVFGERLSPSNWLGVAVAFGGVIVISLARTSVAGDWKGVALLLIASVATMGYNLFNKSYLARYRPLDLTTWAIWAGALGLLPVGLGLPERLATAPAEPLANLIALGLIPGALCYVLYTWVLSQTSLARLSSTTFLIPVGVLVMAYLGLDDTPQPIEIGGGAVVLVGVWLATRRPARRRPAPALVEPDGGQPVGG